MIDIQLTKICIGNQFKEGFITSIISKEEIIINNNEVLRFQDLTPIEFTQFHLKEEGYSEDSTINRNAKIFLLDKEKSIQGEIFEIGFYLADKNDKIISHRIKYLHEFQNMMTMFFDYESPFD